MNERTLATVDGEAAAEMPAASPLQTAIDAALATLDDPTLSRVGYLRAALERARAIPVHPAHQDEAARVLEEFTRLGVEALRADVGNAFGRLPELTRKFFTLQQAPPVLPEREIWEPRILKTRFLTGDYRDVSYGPEEVLSLWRVLRADEKISGFDVFEVRTTSRTISRRELRLGCAAHWETLLPTWDAEKYLRRFPELPPKSARRF